LRQLAHGIFPPALLTGGLSEALAHAAATATLPTTIEAMPRRRYAADIEAAVYFCCLEALQNAAKHGGQRASAVISLGDKNDELRFSVVDDGVGFGDSPPVSGHGFSNMTDRLGALGGTLTVTSAPAGGITVAGVIPLPTRSD